MTEKLTTQSYIDSIISDKTRLKNFIRAVEGPSRRELEGNEYEKVWTLLQMLEPYCSSNNQRFFTDKYRLGDLRYNVTYGIYDYPIIEAVDEDITHYSVNDTEQRNED